MKNAEIVLRAEVLYLGVQQVQVVFECFALKRLSLRCVGGEGLVRCAVLHVDAVDIVNKLHDLVIVHKVGKPATECGREVVLAVGESACAAEAAHGIANRAVDTFLDLARNDGTVTGIYVSALLKHDDFKVRMPANKFITGENSCGAAADNGNIVSSFHFIHSRADYGQNFALCIIRIKRGIVIKKL